MTLILGEKVGWVGAIVGDIVGTSLFRIYSAKTIIPSKVSSPLGIIIEVGWTNPFAPVSLNSIVKEYVTPQVA